MIKITCTCNKQFDSVEECRKWHEDNKVEVVTPKHSFKFDGKEAEK